MCVCVIDCIFFLRHSLHLLDWKRALHEPGHWLPALSLSVCVCNGARVPESALVNVHMAWIKASIMICRVPLVQPKNT